MFQGNANGSSVVLDNVDDYLAPSQACINPLFQPKKAEGPIEGVGKEDTSSLLPAVVVPRKRKVVRRRPIVTQTDDSLAAEPQNNGVPANTTDDSSVNKKNPKDDVIKASIADCLACSGCVTTAETVLLEQHHSLTSLRGRLSSKEQQEHRRKLVVTISPNSWADMCRHWNLSSKKNNEDDDEMDAGPNRLAQFSTLLSKILSADAVVDGNVPLQWTWNDEAEEFCKSYENISNLNFPDTSHSLSGPSAAIDSMRTQFYNPDGSVSVVQNDKQSAPPQLPVISGSCPALVCLVEKNLHELVPHLSQSMSPMSMLGVCLKVSQNDDISWDHWAVMPCHDKKLEASRKDYYLTADNGAKGTEGQHAVDLVISTQECVELVEEWIQSQFVEMSDSFSYEETKIPPMTDYLDSYSPCHVATVWDQNQLRETLQHASCTMQPMLLSPPQLQCDPTVDTVPADEMQMAFASGGHANFIFLYAAKKLFGCNLNKVEWRPAPMSLIGQTMNKVRSARLGRQQKQHFYEACLYRHLDGSYSTAATKLHNENQGDSSPVLHFCIAHGMQTMQRALKLVKSQEDHNNSKRDIPKFHYLEAMACPHGCVNGGGTARQVGRKTESNESATTTTVASSTAPRETPTETRARVKSTLDLLSVPIATNVLGMASTNPDTVPQFHKTRFHIVPPMQHTMGAVAGEKVDDIIW